MIQSLAASPRRDSIRGPKCILRYALYQAAMIASLKNRDVMIHYTNKIREREGEKGIHFKMRVKAGGKVARDCLDLYEEEGTI